MNKELNKNLNEKDEVKKSLQEFENCSDENTKEQDKEEQKQFHINASKELGNILNESWSRGIDLW